MAQRPSLREFQQRLARRLAVAEMSASVAYMLGIESAGETWAMPLGDASEVITVPTLTATPLSKHWFTGLANVRGTLYGVIDFGAFRGRRPVRAGPTSRVVLCGKHLGMNAGLLVDRVLGLRDEATFATAESDPAPPLWQKRTIRDASGLEYRELDIRTLMSSPQFMDVRV
jgi:twitching motility protein PilI